MLNCLVCDKALKSAYQSEKQDPQSIIEGGCLGGGVLVSTQGGYGSTVIDDSFEDFTGGGAHKHYFAICDDCLLIKSDKIYECKLIDHELEIKIENKLSESSELNAHIQRLFKLISTQIGEQNLKDAQISFEKLKDLLDDKNHPELTRIETLLSFLRGDE